MAINLTLAWAVSPHTWIIIYTYFHSPVLFFYYLYSFFYKHFIRLWVSEPGIFSFIAMRDQGCPHETSGCTHIRSAQQSRQWLHTRSECTTHQTKMNQSALRSGGIPFSCQPKELYTVIPQASDSYLKDKELTTHSIHQSIIFMIKRFMIHAYILRVSANN